jgi:hypothetical protein
MCNPSISLVYSFYFPSFPLPLMLFTLPLSLVEHHLLNIHFQLFLPHIFPRLLIIPFISLSGATPFSSISLSLSLSLSSSFRSRLTHTTYTLCSEELFLGSFLLFINRGDTSSLKSITITITSVLYSHASFCTPSLPGASLFSSFIICLSIPLLL